MHRKFHEDQKREKHLKWGAKKVSGEEGRDARSRSILDQFQTVIKSDQKWISKWCQRHYNPYTVFYSYTKFGNDRSIQIGLFRSLKIKNSAEGYIYI